MFNNNFERIWCFVFARVISKKNSKCQPKYYDFDPYKGFSMEKMAQIC
jgi:hypothetical protein